jgi:predicted porin
MKVVLVSALLLLTLSPIEAKEINELINIYGSLRPEVVFRTPEAKETIRVMEDGYSRVGLKGKAKISNTLSGFYKYERRVSANDGEDDGAVRGDNNELRQVHVGLTGNYGSISIGRHYSLYYDYIEDEIDRHRSHYSDAIVFSSLFVSNSILYNSPKIGAFSFGALAEFNGSDPLGRAVDERFEIAGTLSDKGFAIHAGYIHSPNHEGLFGISPTFSLGGVTLAGVYQRLKKAGDDDKITSLAADIAISPRNTIRVARTVKRTDNTPDLDVVSLIVGGDHKFSDHVIFYIESFRKTTDVPQLSDETAVVTGLRFDF